MPVSYRSGAKSKGSHGGAGGVRGYFRSAGPAGRLIRLPRVSGAVRYGSVIPWVLAGAAFILSRGRIMTVLAPFHIAFTAAVIVLFPGLARWAIAGAVIGRALWSGAADALFDGITLLAVAGALQAARQFFPAREEAEQITPPVSWRWAAAAAAGAGLGTGFQTLIMSPNAFGIVVLFFRMALAALLTPLFAHGLASIYRRFTASQSAASADSAGAAGEHQFWLNHDEGLCIALLGAALVASLAGLQWGPIAPASVAAGLLVLSFAAWGGAAAGAAAGASVAAITMLGGSFGVLPVAAHALAGLLAGLLREFGGIGCAAGYATGVVLMAAFTLDSGTMTAELWGLMPAIILFTVIDISTLRKDHMLNFAGGSSGGPAASAAGAGRPDGLLIALGRPEKAAAPGAAAGGEGSRGPVEGSAPGSGKPGTIGAREPDPSAGPSEPRPAGAGDGGMAGRHVGGHGSAGGQLAGLATVVGEMAAALEPSRSNGDSFQRRKMHGLMSKLAGDVCAGCVHEHTCWDREFFTTYKGLSSLIARKETTGRAHARHLPEKLRLRCPRTDRLVAGVNHAYELLHAHRSWWQRLHDARSLVAHQMLALSNAAAGLAASVPAPDAAPVVSAPAHPASPGRGGSQHHRQTASGRDRSRGAGFRAPLGGGPVLTLPLAPGERPSSFAASSNSPRLPAGPPEQPMMTYRAAAARVARDRKLVSGDSYLYRLITANRLAMVLSDGMGAGVTAAKESRTTINLLERCLELGLDPEQAIEMVNNVLLLRFAEDTFATLDLTLVDLSRPTAQFIKIGAPPSFVRRRDHVSIIRAGTPPMGILEEVHMEVAHRHLRSGDLIVMVTDGVIAAWDSVAAGEEWIKGFLASLPHDKPRWVATRMIREALRRTEGQPPDDMTALVVKLM